MKPLMRFHGISWQHVFLVTLLFIALLDLISPAVAQDAVPTEILRRTFLIRVGNEAGTAFTIDYKGKLYLVTARHVVAALPAGKTTLQLWQSGQWLNYQIEKTLFPSSSDVDIAVLETKEQVKQPFGILPMGQGDTSESATMGQQLWFLGYPFGDPSLTSRFSSSNDAPIPFIKRGTMSAIDGSKPDAVVIYIDGFNNPGFSGGPIVYWDFGKRVYRILGVVKGYRFDAAKVALNGQAVDSNILTNSGILIAYSIQHALDAIDKDQKR